MADDPMTTLAAEMFLRQRDDAMREVERLREIERVFNEGWLPPLPGEPATLRLRSLHRLRELIPDSEA